ncbi:hypothetical protein K445DRAFT_318640 [Daldinia sp. EC12]|nr:hypothetical protein K445DRAFT_318640 [Daldinia sp. EC12]
MKPSIHSELFAFGSLSYEGETTYKPYHDKNDREVEELFEADEYPNTSGMVLDNIIRKCWLVKYQSAGEAMTDIKMIQDLL